MKNHHDIEIKICGLTDPAQAADCAGYGVDAVGVVFFPRSPRHVSTDMAAAVVHALPPPVLPVGVFVNPRFSYVMEKVARCGIRGVQLHGQETPAFVRRLSAEGLKVYKTLFWGQAPVPPSTRDYKVAAYVVECAGGELPGGNGMAWSWRAVRDLPGSRPLILAGGITPENVTRAMDQARPDAMDISSGVETEPGRKDPEKVGQLIQQVRNHQKETGLNRISPGPVF
ncbi:MAG: phosphoribosylanthranilate isomerase [Desulfobacteraceae bacterium]|nr:phosphoribosylanthranilate isomerase [Desulfobacteraceae bacterium]